MHNREELKQLDDFFPIAHTRFRGNTMNVDGLRGYKLLITGGSGFIGSQVIDIALEYGLEVKNLDLVRPKLPGHDPYWSQVDIRDEKRVNHEFLQFSPDCVAHLASDTNITFQSLDNYSTIIRGTKIVAAAAKRLDPQPRFLHVSTQFVVMPGKQPTSDTEFAPYTLYGEAKAISEKIVRSSGLAALTIVRPTVIWGPRHPTYADQIWKYIARRQYLHPKFRTPVKRTYGYVRNTAAQMFALLAVATSERRNLLFYLGDGAMLYDDWVDAFSLALTERPCRRIPKKLLFTMCAAGSTLAAVGIHGPVNMGRYFRMTTSMEIDLSKTFAVLGRPKITFEQGLAETLTWLREQDNIFNSTRMLGPSSSLDYMDTSLHSTPQK